jgi:hypothetical protein
MADVKEGLPVPPEFVMINSYLIDVSISEDHTFDAEVTDYPVESGSSFADHIRKKPITVTMDGLVPNNPFGNIALKRKSAGEQQAFSVLGQPSDLGKAAASEAYAVLLSVWNAGEPVTIRTSLGTFERMAMTSLSIPRDAQTGDALKFSASFQQIQIVTNERIRKRTATRTGGKRDLGAKAVVEKNQPLIVWRKGRNFFDTAYVGGGEWFGESEQLVIATQPNGIDRKLSHIGNASIDNFAGNSNTEAGTTGGSWTVDYTPLSAGELVRFEKDRARDERLTRAGRNLREGAADTKRSTTDLSEKSRSTAGDWWTGK